MGRGTSPHHGWVGAQQSPNQPPAPIQLLLPLCAGWQRNWTLSEIQPKTNSLLATPSVVPTQGFLLAVLSSVLCFSAFTAQKDVRNLHLTPWVQYRLPKPCYLREYSSAPCPCRVGEMLWPREREQRFLVLLCSVRHLPGTSPVFGGSTDKPCPSPCCQCCWHKPGAPRGAQSHPPSSSAPSCCCRCLSGISSHLSLVLGDDGLCLLCAGSTLCAPASLSFSLPFRLSISPSP